MGSIPPPMQLSPDSIRRRKTIVQGEWYINIGPSSDGVLFFACNNEYERLMSIVRKRSLLFNILFGCFTNRLTKAKEKHQKFIDNKNAAYFHTKQIVDII